jgi:hypothetical protein
VNSMNKSNILMKPIGRFLDSVFYYLLWIFIYAIVTEVIDPDGPSRIAYGIISAWWATLYFCLLRAVKLKQIAYFVPLGVGAYCYMATRWPKGGFSVINIVSGLFFFVSPIILNSCVVWLNNSIEKRRMQKKRKICI